MLRTKQQRRTLCDCPVGRVADLVGDSCSLLIIRDLLDQPLRFSEIQHSLEGVSTRTVASKLKYLEARDLIKRAKTANGNARVYSVTKKGAALKDIVDDMRAYGKKYL